MPPCQFPAAGRIAVNMAIDREIPRGASRGAASRRRLADRPPGGCPVNLPEKYPHMGSREIGVARKKIAGFLAPRSC